MARPPRIDAPGLIHHVTHRGNNRQRIFEDADAYQRYLDLLDEGVSRFGHDILAFCLMPNHVHLVVRTQDVSLSEVIHNAAFRFAAWTNRRSERVGHLFQGRFHSRPVARTAYLLAVVRYVHQNPVRAGMVARPEHHAWNSHRDYLGERRHPWVRPGPVLEILDPDVEAARLAFRKLCAELIDEPVPAPPVDGDPTPTAPTFRRPRLRRDVPLERIVAVVAGELGIREADVMAPSASRFEPAAPMVALILRECGNEPVSRWADRLGRDGASLSRSLRRLERRVTGDRHLRGTLQRVRHALGLPEGPAAFDLTG